MDEATATPGSACPSAVRTDAGTVVWCSAFQTSRGFPVSGGVVSASDALSTYPSRDPARKSGCGRARYRKQLLAGVGGVPLHGTFHQVHLDPAGQPVLVQHAAAPAFPQVPSFPPPTVTAAQARTVATSADDDSAVGQLEFAFVGFDIGLLGERAVLVAAHSTAPVRPYRRPPQWNPTQTGIRLSAQNSAACSTRRAVALTSSR